MQERKFDIVIIGGGPAGLTAGLYAARGGRSTAVIERTAVGGQSVKTSEIDNYPGISSISGFDLAQRIEEQGKSFGMQTLGEEVLSVDLDAKKIETDGGTIFAKAIILCMGADARKLGVPGEQEFAGSGVSYCATCDGAFFRKREVAVVGGGNTAAVDALYLSRLAAKVYLIHRKDALRATKTIADKVLSLPNVEFVKDTVVTELTGGGVLESLKVRNIKSGGEREIKVSGLFVAVGMIPNTALIAGKVATDDYGYIVTGEDMSLSGYANVFAAGDIRSKELRQVVTACSDGAVAAEAALKALG